MRSSAFLVIVYGLLLQGESSLASGDQEIHVTREVSLGDQCNGYCFSVLKPFLDYFTQLKEATNANNEMRDKINSLEVTISNLQSQLLKNNIEKIKDKDNQIKDKDNQIKGLREQMDLVSGVLAEKNDQLSKINQTAENIPETCGSGTPNGIFQIKVRGIEPFQVPCVSDSSGWALIQRRVNSNENFNRSWADYKMGFGDLRENFFLGLEKIHRMTLLQPHELYIQLKDVKGSTRYARYDDFKIGSEAEAYELKSLGKYSGTAGDSLTQRELNMKFSTLDRDNDANEESNCAKKFGGGWWFSACAQSHLNGNYYKDGTSEVHDGIVWGTWKDYDFSISLTFSQMMIRPKTL
ncbi:fibrinogen-like protein 1 [Drosophila miranda]|uniref:fibrinogen-like protein 1 n=1 Tax=Drosophila miranda TaxID=7229 RepID=UPI00143FAD99|nr:fibrinogen-like protein 1 [Drosophila miranda]